MWQFYKSIILRALSGTPALVSSNWLAVGVSIIVLVATFIFRVRRQQSYKDAVNWGEKLTAMRDHWLRDGFISVIVTTIAWALLFAASLTRTLYSQHQTISARASTLERERDAARSERDQIKNKVDAVENNPAKVVHVPTPAKTEKPKPAVEQHSQGDNSPNVGTITQGAGSIAQVGGAGNQATVNNFGARLPRLVEVSEKQTPNPDGTFTTVCLLQVESDFAPGHLTIQVLADGLKDVEIMPHIEHASVLTLQKWNVQKGDHFYQATLNGPSGQYDLTVTTLRKTKFTIGASFN